MTKKQRELLMQIDKETVKLHIWMDAALRIPTSENGRKFTEQSDLIHKLRQQFIDCED